AHCRNPANRPHRRLVGVVVVGAVVGAAVHCVPRSSDDWRGTTFSRRTSSCRRSYQGKRLPLERAPLPAVTGSICGSAANDGDNKNKMTRLIASAATDFVLP